MNNRPTPETDAARHDLSDYGSPVPCSWGDWIHADVASKLERERDEAIADRDIARLIAMDSDRAHDRMVGELEKVYKERDEAREAWGQASMDAAQLLSEKTKVMAERDEARESAAKWEAVALREASINGARICAKEDAK